MLKPLLIALAITAGAAGARAAEPTAAEPTAADSVSTAFGTVWGSYIHGMLDREFPADTHAVDQFVEGVSDAFSQPAAREAYYQGILQGFTVIQRLSQMSDLGFPIDKDAFIAALRATLAGQPTGFTPESADTYLNSYMARQYEAQMAADTLSTASQREFLDRESARDGAITTPSGLVFQVITEGEGTGPTMDDAVAITYTGRLYNGTIFDQADEPVELPLKGLVPGFSQGLLMMKPGGTYRIIIPADLGYGPMGTAGVIPGNAALDFTITLDHVIKR